MCNTEEKMLASLQEKMTRMRNLPKDFFSSKFPLHQDLSGYFNKGKMPLSSELNTFFFKAYFTCLITNDPGFTAVNSPEFSLEKVILSIRTKVLKKRFRTNT